MRCVLAFNAWCTKSIFNELILLCFGFVISFPLSLPYPLSPDFFSVDGAYFPPLPWLVVCHGSISIQELAANGRSLWMSTGTQPSHCNLVIKLQNKKIISMKNCIIVQCMALICSKNFSMSKICTVNNFLSASCLGRKLNQWDMLPNYLLAVSKFAKSTLSLGMSMLQCNEYVRKILPKFLVMFKKIKTSRDMMLCEKR